MKNLLKDTPVEVLLKVGVSFYRFLGKSHGKCKRNDEVWLSVALWVVVLGVIPALQHLSR